MLWGLLPSAAGNPAVATEGWGQASLLDDEGCMVIVNKMGKERKTAQCGSLVLVLVC